MVCPYNASRDSVRKDLELSGRNLTVSRYEHSNQLFYRIMLRIVPIQNPSFLFGTKPFHRLA